MSDATSSKSTRKTYGFGMLPQNIPPNTPRKGFVPEIPKSSLTRAELQKELPPGIKGAKVNTGLTRTPSRNKNQITSKEAPIAQKTKISLVAPEKKEPIKQPPLPVILPTPTPTSSSLAEPEVAELSVELPPPEVILPIPSTLVEPPPTTPTETIPTETIPTTPTTIPSTIPTPTETTPTETTTETIPTIIPSIIPTTTETTPTPTTGIKPVILTTETAEPPNNQLPEINTSVGILPEIKSTSNLIEQISNFPIEASSSSSSSLSTEEVLEPVNNNMPPKTTISEPILESVLENNKFGVITSQYAVNENQNSAILEIFDIGINKIIHELKTKLGVDIANTNRHASEIFSMLNTLSKDIKNENFENGITNDKIAGKHSSYKKTEADSQNDINTFKINDPKNIQFLTDRKNKFQPYKYANLDDRNKIYDSQREETIDLDSSNGIERVENRLKNCQNLEKLYLIKHDELMTTFHFTIELFDRYNYAIKVILYLMKHLVYKKGGVNPNKKQIKLPKKIIEGLDGLLASQQNVQGVIQKMSQELEKQPLRSLEEGMKNIVDTKVDHNDLLNVNGKPVQINEADFTNIQRGIPPAFSTPPIVDTRSANSARAEFGGDRF